MIIFLQLVAHFLDNGAEVRFAAAGADDEIIRDVGQFPEVQDDHILCLPVFGQFPAEQGQFP